MIIIGITGGIGHGKTTLAAAFSRLEPHSVHFETFELVAEVANTWHAKTSKLPNPHKLEELNEWLQLLPAIIKDVLHQDIDPSKLQFTTDDITAHPELYEKLFTHLQNLHKNPGLLNASITDTNKVQYRAILQWLGGYLELKVASGIWYNEIMRRIHQLEAQGIVLCTIGGVRFPIDADIVRDNGGQIILIHRPLLNEQDLRDPTERDRSKIIPNATLVNDAGLVELVRCAQNIYTDIKLGKLQTTYSTSELRQSTTGSS